MRPCRAVAGRRPRAESGFTVVELLITLALAGMGMTAGFYFYASAVGRTADTEARVDSIADVRNTGELIARDVRESGAICTPAGATNVLSLAASSSTPCTATVVWNCAATPGTCTRTEGGDTETVIEGLSTSSTVFTPASNYVSIRLNKLPDGRDGEVTIERGAAVRVCQGTC